MIFDRLTIEPRIDYEAEIFYETMAGVVYPITPVKAKTKLTQGRRIPLTGMFELYEMLGHQDLLVGYLFKSSFAMEALGGYLVTFLKAKGQADSHEVVLKLDHLIVYNFPNRGTLAASPKVKDSITQILESQ